MDLSPWCQETKRHLCLSRGPLRSSQTMLEQQTWNSIHIPLAQTVLQIPSHSLSSFILIRTPGRGPPPSDVMTPFADGEIVTQKQKMTWPKLMWPVSGRAQYTAQVSHSTIPRNSNLPWSGPNCGFTSKPCMVALHPERRDQVWIFWEAHEQKQGKSICSNVRDTA